MSIVGAPPIQRKRRTALPTAYGSRVERRFGLAVVALWVAFAALTAAVWRADGAANEVELRMAVGLHEWALGQPWSVSLSRALDVVGGGLACSAVVVIAASVLVLMGALRGSRGPRTYALVLLVASAMGGVILSEVVKQVVARPRPPWNGLWLVETSASYPSGHAQAGITVWAALGVAILMVGGRRTAWLAATPLILLGPLIGASRAIVGVHWPTDVLGGWLLGAAWLGTCLLVLRRVREREAGAGRSRR